MQCLCISRSVLQRLKSKKTSVVTHVSSKRWKDAYDKKAKIIKFYDIVFSENAVFLIKDIQLLQKQGETIIRIEVSEEIL